MLITARCNNAGPLATAIPTRSLAARLLARLRRLRW
jgi:hypothetical protein